MKSICSATLLKQVSASRDKPRDLKCPTFRPRGGPALLNCGRCFLFSDSSRRWTLVYRATKGQLHVYSIQEGRGRWSENIPEAQRAQCVLNASKPTARHPDDCFCDEALDFQTEAWRPETPQETNGGGTGQGKE